jgi:hypothetical protein
MVQPTPDIILEMDVPQYAINAILSGEYAVIAYLDVPTASPDAPNDTL